MEKGSFYDILKWGRKERNERVGSRMIPRLRTYVGGGGDNGVVSIE